MTQQRASGAAGFSSQPRLVLHFRRISGPAAFFNARMQRRSAILRRWVSRVVSPPAAEYSLVRISWRDRATWVATLTSESIPAFQPRLRYTLRERLRPGSTQLAGLATKYVTP